MKKVTDNEIRTWYDDELLHTTVVTPNISRRTLSKQKPNLSCSKAIFVIFMKFGTAVVPNKIS
jgi:hypothetical protein